MYSANYSEVQRSFREIAFLLAVYERCLVIEIGFPRKVTREGLLLGCAIPLVEFPYKKCKNLVFSNLKF